MLVGLPGSGKSALQNRLRCISEGVYVCVYSTDAIIEARAIEERVSYNKIFCKEILRIAKQACEADLQFAKAMGVDVIWDQTNLTKKSRASKLKKIPDNYRKIAVYFEPNIEKCLKINRQREVSGRSIPLNVLNDMIVTIEKPTEDEGFDKVFVINSWEELNALSKEDLVNL